MDFFQGIPVEYELDTFNTPPQEQLYVTPKIGYVNAMPLFRSRHLALNSPQGHFNDDNAHSPPDAQNSRWLQSSFPPTARWLSLNYSEHNPSQVRRYALPFSTLSYLHFVSLFTILLTTSLAAQTQTTFSMLQIKTILKNTFWLRTSWTFSFKYTAISESLSNLARKQLNVNTHKHVTTFHR